MKYQMRSNISIIELTDEQVKGLQSNILDCLVEFDRICRAYNIPYAIDGGTLLGAVRHKGFIPWDTDADVVILRRDYERFYMVCKSKGGLDHKRFFLQDYTTDPYYRWGYSRLLLKGTRYVRAGYEHIPAQDGVFLDIFIMDGVPDNILLRRIHLFTSYCIQKTLWSEAGKRVHPNRLMRMWYSILSKIPRNLVMKTQLLIANYNNKRKHELISHMCSPHPKDYPYGFPKKIFKNLSEYEFEGHLFFGFSNYDWYLRSIYRNYMKLPPIEERKTHIPCSYLEFDDIS
ncbi:MAG: hypothetical protein GX129_05580 [Clostridiales bacterium]|jgi:lipopolysaccharide cholinephosphotransferase|nr:hypothetical protein [Clostridiales bacterium]